ncbi:MAG: hypothetical protein RJB25_515 [Bacteroidota bacterium]
MKIKLNQAISGLAIFFGLLSLFSIWNVYNWDILGWGTKLFLFPFLAVISFLAKLTPEKPKLFVRLQLGLLGLHTLLYLWVFNFQDPHAPNLLLLLLSLFWATLLLLLSKTQALRQLHSMKRDSAIRRIEVLLVGAALVYLIMALFALPDLILLGILLEVAGLVFYFALLMRP